MYPPKLLDSVGIEWTIYQFVSMLGKVAQLFSIFACLKSLISWIIDTFFDLCVMKITCDKARVERICMSA